jgi:hypothetical protein
MYLNKSDVPSSLGHSQSLNYQILIWWNWEIGIKSIETPMVNVSRSTSWDYLGLQFVIIYSTWYVEYRAFYHWWPGFTDTVLLSKNICHLCPTSGPIYKSTHGQQLARTDGPPILLPRGSLQRMCRAISESNGKVPRYISKAIVVIILHTDDTFCRIAPLKHPSLNFFSAGARL